MKITDLKKHIRDVPNFPQEGIIFKDISTLLQNKAAFKKSIDLLAHKFNKKKIEYVVGVESRGFIFSPILAYKLKAGFVPVRKPGKLPHKTLRTSYELEYGSNELEIHEDAVLSGTKVAVVDDLLATGGTAQAAVQLVEKLGGKVVAVAFLVELSFLKGRDKLKGYDVFSLIQY